MGPNDDDAWQTPDILLMMGSDEPLPVGSFQSFPDVEPSEFSMPISGLPLGGDDSYIMDLDSAEAHGIDWADLMRPKR